MKKTKIFGGLGVLLLSAIGAFATTSTHRDNIYWFDNGGIATSVSVPFNCPNLGFGCVGTSGLSKDHQLYLHSTLETAIKP